MADDQTGGDVPSDANSPENFLNVAQQIVAAIAQTYTQNNLKDTIASAHVGGHAGVLEMVVKFLVPLAVKVGELVHTGEEAFLPVFAGLAAPIVAGLFGAEIDAAAFADKAASGSRAAAARALVEAFIQALEGDGADQVQPGRDGATRVASAAMNATLEGWFQGAAVEIMLDCFPADIGHMTALTELPEEVIRTLGIGRLVRRALSPLVDAVAAEPMRWDVNKKYRPKLLAASTVLRAFVRGRWDWDTVAEELARDGYDDTRIEELYNEARKFLSADDLADLLWLELISIDEADQTMLDQGYDEQTASKHLNVRKIRKEDALRHELAAVAITAYVDRRIDDGQLAAVLGQNITGQHERDLLTAIAVGKRALNFKVLSAAQVETAVLADVLAFPDYRDALAREGYTDDAIDILDILLRQKKQSTIDTATHRANLAAEKTAAAKAKADAAAAKKAEIDQARQLKAQGSIAELEHAVITGLVPMDRLVQILTPQFTADTVAIYVADVTQKKAAFDALEQKKEDAATRAANRDIPLATLEQAVYDGIIPIDKLATLLTQRGMSDADVSILAQVISAKKADLDAAKQKRAQADQRATAKKISLQRAEALVQLGHWTIAQYQQLIASLGFDDAAIAGMVDLLQSKIDARAAAAKLRSGVAAGSVSKGLSLEQFRKAVIAGAKTLDDFSTYLHDAGYTADASAVLLDELAADVDGAHAAQLRRQQGDTTGGAVAIKLSTAQKAARLGVITPAAYQERLVAAGYSDDDIALEMDLLVAEIAGTKAAQKKAAPVPASPASKGLTLTQLADAVKRGAATIGEWQAAARAANLEPDAIETLTAELDDALAVKSDAKNAHDNIAAQLAEQGVTLTDLEQQVRAGSLSVVDLEAQLVGYGFTDVEAQLVGSLLEQELTAAQAA